ncbi:MAG: 2,5-dioxopentanoate dehydrogenase, partial [Mycobacterium sp.]|nr:2,5-dioxopentanoate dehydrogenase [Mycobacterium sp.]
MTATIHDSSHLTGQMIIAGVPVTGTGPEVRGFDPAAGAPVEPAYRHGDVSDVEAACTAAAEAFP